MLLPTFKIIQGNALHVLKELPENSVHCVVTSPPYFRLRVYETEGEEWPEIEYSPMAGVAPIRIPPWHGELGQEPLPELYVGHMIAIFREVHRVLRNDGILWLNIGDAYNGSGGAGGDYNPGGKRDGQPKPPGRNVPYLKPKDMLMIPYRLILALQADGWWVRRDVIWHKPNVFPEGGALDRPTVSHEYVFMLTKNKKYFWDSFAIHVNEIGNGQYRNPRTVWTLNVVPFRGGHFATYPKELPLQCILLSTPDIGVCAACGTPWKRIVERTPAPKELRNRGESTKMSYHPRQIGIGGKKYYDWYRNHPPKTVGWEKQCSCGEEITIPSIVLDPFCGSGTTGVAALIAGRSFIGIELNPKFVQIAKERLAETSPLLGVQQDEPSTP